MLQASTAQNTLEPLRAAGDSKAKDEDMEEERKSLPPPPASKRAAPLAFITVLCFLILAVEYSPFYGIEKGAVLQEARCFNDSHVDPRRCQQVITKLLYLLTQGESFTKVGSGVLLVQLR